MWMPRTRATRTHTRAQTHTHMHLHTDTRTHTHTHPQAHLYAHARTPARTHTRSRPPRLGVGRRGWHWPAVGWHWPAVGMALARGQAAMESLAEADVVIALGCRMNPFGTLPQCVVAAIRTLIPELRTLYS